MGGAGALSGAGGRLRVCATPVGNLDDVTLRVLAALRDADVVACEDTRHTRRLLDRHGIRAAALVSYHEHNERSRARELAGRVEAGETVALVSDAGTPGISDPGYEVVQACLGSGQAVEVLPGASAAVAALVISGLPTARWRFVGFLPRKGGDVARLFATAAGDETLVAYESPRRLAASLGALTGVDPGRRVAVCRELTKVHEEVARGTASEQAERWAREPARGEIVLVVGPPAAGARGEADLAAALAAVRRLVREGGARPRVAAGVVAELTGASANALYDSLIDEKE